MKPPMTREGRIIIYGAVDEACKAIITLNLGILILLTLRERERERERETDRQTDRQTETETETERQRKAVLLGHVLRAREGVFLC